MEEQQKEEEREKKERENHPSCGSLLKCPEKIGLGQAKELHLGGMKQSTLYATYRQVQVRSSIRSRGETPSQPF